ncbi:glycoside hydrolase family 113 [Rhodopseudomonas sp. RCAM05734]|uniref:glycoside hydrolase family 113 n=1 Tax=Rhodopseudomonas sp. RCAM05734 TaxID=3457549 RepID=UPI0040445A4E
MAGIFQVQGFGALSEYNGQFATTGAAQSFQNMASLGSNSVALTVRIWTDSKTGSTVIAHPDKTESDASLLAGFQAAHAAGLSVAFKPGITGLDSTISSSLQPADVDAFFASYRAEIVHLAGIAEQGGVKTFAIGNEMSKLSGSAYLGQWTDLISAVRQVYHGELTYAAATDEASKVSFWSQLDTISVNTYPPLTSSTTPTVADLVHAWTEVPYNPYYAAAFNYKSPVDFLHSLSLDYGKPVMMSEVGYRSIDGTAINPGGGSSKAPADAAEQADAYNAFFQVWSTQGGSWLKGAEFWQWDLNGNVSPTGYSVQGKPAQDVVSQYFHGNGAIPGRTVEGSVVADIIDSGSGNDTIHGGPGSDLIRGGAGNDTIVGGPDTIARLTTTTVTITGYGSVVAGVGAQARILVNGTAVSGLLEFTPATDPQGYQTYTVTFDNPAQISNIAIELANSAPGRALHVKDFAVNGVALVPSQGTNASSPGTFDLYVRTINFDTSAHQDWFVGAASDNDVITGGGGNDTIDGGAGTDTAVYSGVASDYSISLDGRTTVVTDRVSGRDGTDRLSNIEVLKFADMAIDTSTIARASATTDAASTYQIQAADSAGHVTGETVRHADGTRDVYNDAIVGQSYASEHIAIDGTGHTRLVERFFGDGDLAFRQVVNSDGSVSASDYDAGGHLIKFATSHGDGAWQQFTFDATGFETGEITRHADGSRDIHSFGITGKDYTSEHAVRDAAGHSSLIEQFHDNGTLALKQTVSADGVRTLDQYDSRGQMTQQTVMQKDGSFVQSKYALDGALAIETTRHADGSRDVDTFGIEGKAYSARHDGFDAAGHRLSTVFDNHDGSHTMTAYAPDVTLTSTAASDVMNSAGGDRFVFREASGHDVINNFKAGEGPGRDVLEIASSIAADLEHLSVHVVGTDTIIDLGHDASIRLTGVVMPLTSHDVLIV